MYKKLLLISSISISILSLLTINGFSIEKKDHNYKTIIDSLSKNGCTTNCKTTFYGSENEFGGTYNQENGIFSVHPLTASGEEYIAVNFTAASNLFNGQVFYARVTNIENHSSIVVRINDNGIHSDSQLDLSAGAFWTLNNGDLCAGTITTNIEYMKDAPNIMYKSNNSFRNINFPNDCVK